MHICQVLEDLRKPKCGKRAILPLVFTHGDIKPTANSVIWYCKRHGEWQIENNHGHRIMKIKGHVWMDLGMPY